MGKKFRRNHNLGKIRKRKIYTVKEISELLSVHVRTVHRWLDEGLLAYRETSPFYITGKDLYNHLRKQRKQRRHSLKAYELFCSRCQKPRKGKPKSYELRATEKRLGQSAKSFILSAICVFCGQRMIRFSSDRQIPILVKEGLPLSMHHQVLKGYGISPSNADNKEVQIEG